MVPGHGAACDSVERSPRQRCYRRRRRPEASPATTSGRPGGSEVDAVLERLDDQTRGMGTTDYNHDLVR